MIGIVFTLFMLIAIDIANAEIGDTRSSELASANVELNTTYEVILASLNDKEKANLKKAQRAWLTFRDLDCKWAFTAEQLTCLLERTRNRIEELKYTNFRDSNGQYKFFGETK